MCSHRIWQSCLSVVSDFLMYCHYISYYRVRLTALRERWYFCELCLLVWSLTPHSNIPPSCLVIMKIPVRITNCGIHLNVIHTRTVFIIYRNVASRLKTLLDRERRTLLGQYSIFFCHLGFKVYRCQAVALAPCGKLWVLHLVPIHFRN
jgi:hypothetical protein